MKTSWTQGLDKESSKDVRVNYLEALVIRRRLEEMLRKKITNSVENSNSKSNYDSPNWPYLQADSRGYERALQEVIQLICT